MLLTLEELIASETTPPAAISRRNGNRWRSKQGTRFINFRSFARSLPRSSFGPVLDFRPIRVGRGM